MGFSQVGGGSGSNPFKGNWDALTNTPDLTAVNLNPKDGDRYYVTVGGTQDLGGGNITFAPNDTAKFVDATIGWVKIDNTPTASETANDSTVAGTTVANALDTNQTNANSRALESEVYGGSLAKVSGKAEVVTSSDFALGSELNASLLTNNTGAPTFDAQVISSFQDTVTVSSSTSIDNSGVRTINSGSINFGTKHTNSSGAIEYVYVWLSELNPTVLQINSTPFGNTQADSITAIGGGFLYKFPLRIGELFNSVWRIDTSVGSLVRFGFNADPITNQALALSTSTQAKLNQNYIDNEYTTTTTATIVDTNGNQLHKIDSTAGAFTITLPASPTNGRKLLLVGVADQLATNNVTIAGNGKNIEGATSLLLNQNRQSVAMRFDSVLNEWYLTAERDTDFQVVGNQIIAMTGKEIVADALKTGGSAKTYQATGDATTGDFLNAQSNAEYDATLGAWKNALVAGANKAPLATVVSTVGFLAFGGGTAWGNVTDGSLSNTTSADARIAGVGNFDLDFTTPIALNRLSVKWYDDGAQRKSDYQVLGSADNVTYTPITGVIDTTSDVFNALNINDFSNSTAYRYYRIDFTNRDSANGPLVSEIELYSTTEATSSNQFDSKINVATAKNWAPASAVFKNDSNVDLVDGQMTIGYSFDNITFTAQDTISAFKALSKTLFVNKLVWFRHTLIGSNTLKTDFLATEGAEFRAGTDARVIVDGVEKLTANGSELKTTMQIYSATVALTDGATINTDSSLSNDFELNGLTQSTTLANPTNPKSGSSYSWLIKSDVVGGHVLTLGSKFKLGYGVASIPAFGASQILAIHARYNLTFDIYDTFYEFK